MFLRHNCGIAAVLSVTWLAMLSTLLMGQASSDSLSVTGAFYTLGNSYCVGGQLVAVPGTNKFLFMERPSARHPDKGSANAGLMDYVTGAFENVKCATSLENCGHTFLRNGSVMVMAGHKPQSQYPEGRKGIRILNTTSLQLVDVSHLQYGHWLATATRLPNGMITVMSDSPAGTDVAPTSKDSIKNPFYEIWDPTNPTKNTTLVQLNNAFVTNTKYFYYPFNFILPSGDMFVWANKYGQIIDPMTGKTKVVLPQWTAAYPHVLTQYPFSGTAFMLPLTPDNYYSAEIMICGGQFDYGWINTTAVKQCFRLKIDYNTNNNTYTIGKWQAETMPGPRVSGTATLLPNGKVVLINGAKAGLLGDAATGGVAMLNNPNFWPYLYDPSAAAGSRFKVLARSQIPRLLHSTAGLTPDGSIIVAGGDRSDKFWVESGVSYSKCPTGFPEYRVEIFKPPYLFNSNRPQIVSAPSYISYNATTFISYSFPSTASNLTITSVVLVAPSSDTHTFNMHQRVVGLQILDVESTDTHTTTNLVVRGPPNINVAPPGPYMLFLVTANGTYSQASWVIVDA